MMRAFPCSVSAFGAVMLTCASIGLSAADGTTLMPQMQNGVPYLSGGVGEHDADVMKQAAKDFDLMLTFAMEGTGIYLADVNVAITDAQGRTVLNTVAGPMLLANLPPGTYTVTAQAAGRSFARQVRVRENKLTREVFAWPESLAQTRPEPAPEYP